MCLGEEARALRMPPRPRLAQLPVSPLPHWAHVFWDPGCQLLALPADWAKAPGVLAPAYSHTHPASQSRPPSTDPLPVASSPSSHTPAGPAMLGDRAEPRADLGADDDDDRRDTKDG